MTDEELAHQRLAELEAWLKGCGFPDWPAGIVAMQIIIGYEDGNQAAVDMTPMLNKKNTDKHLNN